MDPDAYVAALRFAAAAHADQRVPGTQLPYLVHLCSVAGEVIAALPVERPDLAVRCALLHDTVEDTLVTLEAVRAAFGSEVAEGVDALTKRASLPKEAQMDDSLERIRACPREIWMVKLADRITNLAPPPGHWTPARCRSYRIEAERILARLGEAHPGLAGRLAQRIAAYRVYEG